MLYADDCIYRWEGNCTNGAPVSNNGENEPAKTNNEEETLELKESVMEPRYEGLDQHSD